MQYPERMHDALFDILGDKAKRISSYHAEDGSGVGRYVLLVNF
jgi:hypothetical protein